EPDATRLTRLGESLHGRGVHRKRSFGLLLALGYDVRGRRVDGDRRLRRLERALDRGQVRDLDVRTAEAGNLDPACGRLVDERRAELTGVTEHRELHRSSSGHDASFSEVNGSP